MKTIRDLSKSALRWLAISSLAIVVVPFLADLGSPLGLGKAGIAYAKDGGGDGGSGSGGGNDGGHDGGHGGGSGGSTSGSGGGHGGGDSKGGSGGSTSASSGRGGSAGSQSSDGGRGRGNSGRDGGEGHGHGGRSAGSAASASVTETSRSGRGAGERSGRSLTTTAGPSVQSGREGRGRGRGPSAQTPEVRVKGAEVKVRGPITETQFTFLVNTLAATPVQEMRLRGVSFTAEQLAALEGALQTQAGLREVRIRETELSQEQFNSLVSTLQGLGIREAEVKAVVDGLEVEAKIEEGQVEVENEAEDEAAEEAAEEAADAAHEAAENENPDNLGGDASTTEGMITGSVTPTM